MNRTAILSSAVSALLLAAPAVGYAQDRQPVAIEHTEACGTVTLTFKNPAASVHGFRWNAVAGKESTGTGARTGLVTVGANATEKQTIRFAEDEFDGTAAVTVSVAFGPDSDIQQRVDIYPVDTDCREGVPTTGPRPDRDRDDRDRDRDHRDRDHRDGRHDDDPTPTTTPTTPTPTPTPTPEPEDDVDCDEVGASEAQRILDADRNDPNNLDQDGDGIACEVDEILPEPDNGNSNGAGNTGEVVTPLGGVNTGGGPA